MRFTGKKRQLVQMKISGHDVAAMVMEIGHDVTTVLNLRTGRLCRVRSAKPRKAKAVETIQEISAS